MPKESFLPSPRKPCTWRLVGGRSGVVVSSRLSTMTPGNMSTAVWGAILAALLCATPSFAVKVENRDGYSAEEITGTSYVTWYGDDETMTVERFVSYCAPILWFSPDEPLLEDRTGKDILIPEAFPFEEAPGRPVVYYRLREVLQRPDGTGDAIQVSADDKGKSILSLSSLAGMDLDFFFYYPREEGLNAHQHDVESVEMKVAVARGTEAGTRYAIAITRTKGKAHGVLWYDNTLESDKYTVMPMHILVEEAKHASCTDKNGDGLYTPGYDVNTRINDAWGVRDIIRSGGLFAASWQSWMAKVRFENTRVFPPLPEDSPRRARCEEDGVYSPHNAIYDLRPFPSDERADAHLKPFIADKGYPDWPEVSEVNSLDNFGKWIGDESFAKSFGVALRMDGYAGISLTFPFWIVKNMEDPLGGGYIVHRLYLTGKNLEDIGWTALYTPSASRWIDPYFAVGVEWRKVTDANGITSTHDDFQLETGLKFRVNMTHTPLKIVRRLGSDFWGFRFGVRNFGAMQINEFGYVVEVGAGSF